MEAYWDSRDRSAPVTKLYTGYQRESQSPNLPEGMILRYSSFFNETLFFCKQSEVWLWPSRLNLGESLNDEYQTLFVYVAKEGGLAVLSSGDSISLWSCLLRFTPIKTVPCESMPRGGVMLSLRGPCDYSRKGFFGGRLLLNKACLLRSAGYDPNEFIHVKSTPADYCFGLRVPKEWVKDKWVIPSMKLEKDSLLHYPSIHDLFNSVKDPCSLLKLLQLGASPNTCDSRGNSLLVAASKADSFLCVKILIEFGADINQQDSFGTCALAAAVVNENMEICSFLKNAKLDTFDIFGDTPLLIACKRSSMKMVDFLLENGANVRLKDRNGFSPAQVARDRGDLDIFKKISVIDEKIIKP